jgi:hypothetical protein
MGNGIASKSTGAPFFAPIAGVVQIARSLHVVRGLFAYINAQ